MGVAGFIERRERVDELKLVEQLTADSYPDWIRKVRTIGRKQPIHRTRKSRPENDACRPSRQQVHGPRSLLPTSFCLDSAAGGTISVEATNHPAHHLNPDPPLALPLDLFFPWISSLPTVFLQLLASTLTLLPHHPTFRLRECRTRLLPFPPPTMSRSPLVSTPAEGSARRRPGLLTTSRSPGRGALSPHKESALGYRRHWRGHSSAKRKEPPPPDRIAISRKQNMSLTHCLQVNEPVLKKVIEWCEQHKKDPQTSTDDDSDSRKKSTDIDEWDQKFMQVDQEMLFEIILVCSPSAAAAPARPRSDADLTHRLPTTLTSSPSSMLVVRRSPT
jgi:hypothetical protein